MPGTMFCESGFEDQRTLQLAIELSMLNTGFGETASPAASVADSDGPLPSSFIVPSGPEESRNKKSQNMTECVPVPSSEHVAEIVGRQGKRQSDFIVPELTPG